MVTPFRLYFSVVAGCPVLRHLLCHGTLLGMHEHLGGLALRIDGPDERLLHRHYRLPSVSRRRSCDSFMHVFQ